MSIKDNILNIKEEISDQVKLVAVSKTRSIDEIKEAYNSNQKIFGENRVQEIVEKQQLLPDDIEWHMIGHLQKNKVKYISNFISLIHSLDRISLAIEIDKCAKKSNRKIDCLIQLKISSEETKFGLETSLLEDFYSLQLFLQVYMHTQPIRKRTSTYGKAIISMKNSSGWPWAPQKPCARGRSLAGPSGGPLGAPPIGALKKWA